MGSKTRTATVATRARLKKKLEAALESVSSLEANVIRMRLGMGAPDGAEVGAPSAGVTERAREKLERIEASVIERFRSACSESRTKRKIISRLKKLNRERS